ncbi:hypothetical protein LSAT2_019569 [Lamellibrachia satsuma]|nr:hypothetical protein LSAT2_019569 [Lamellibrachia satsuma]
MLGNWTSLNDSQSNDIRTRPVPTVAIDALAVSMLVIVIAGVPGNILVVAVYAKKLTSSVRLYMFALALTDVVICISHATMAAIGPARRRHPVYLTLFSVFNFCVEFSLMVLTVTAVERYWSIARPHSFTFSPRRGKVALLLTALLALATLVAIKLFHSFNLMNTARIHMMSHLGLCTLVILVMYSLLARELFLRFRRKKTKLHPSASGNVIARCSHSSNNQSCVATTSTALEPPTGSTLQPSVTSPPMKKTTAVSKQTQEAKAALMLFVVTAVFLACWVPVWLRTVGVSIQQDLLRVYVIQSVVNPAIYGCMSSTFRDDVRQLLASCRRRLIV